MRLTDRIRNNGESTSKSRKATLDVLRVIDELEVGPVKLEKNRLIAGYTVNRSGHRETRNLICRYGENVFDPAKAEDQNLASMIGAQIALNYGLFCNKIIFKGEFDRRDQDFLRGMAENTAREIYVKKFLEPNPFLIVSVTALPAIKRESYLQAKLEFPDGTDNQIGIDWRSTESKRNRIAVLSSGGKDSLLSYGLLHELGYEVHPIFANESGRHWFTALNAFRHFNENIQNTSRVWMNSDRIFAWMLRHLSFVRKGFSSIRFDEYPVRLWTVAVFLFGALPLMRKRGVGRLVIGDEHDTTDRKTYKGITHYNGLYDQSRYFDYALSRYFSGKRWDLSQFSILRPLSELLIQNILVSRYPKLFRHQMSCHAAHVAADRIRPCGRCEKCRRIVGMIRAVGGDPADCGYTKLQVEKCLNLISKKGVHQERAGTQQLMWMLQQKGDIQLAGEQKKTARERPEILRLRFDPDRSPMDSTPKELRTTLYKIFMEYANGAVRRKGRVWIDIDPLSDAALHRPYLFERSKPKEHSHNSIDIKTNSYLLAEMNWQEASNRLKEVDVALLPVGSIEQHGPHLPLDTDAFDADYLAREVAVRCSDPKPLVLPLIPYGVSYHHDDFSGTISIGTETLSQLVYEIGMSTAKSGITKLVIINGHGGNDPALNYAAQKINRDAHIFACVDSGESSDVDISSMIDTPNDVHAGEIETSTSLALRAGLVKMEKAEKFIPQFSNRYLDFTSKRSIPWYAFTKRISDSGIMGDPTKATAEKGKRIWEIMIKNLVAFVEDLKKLTLDEIHQKRY